MKYTPVFLAAILSMTAAVPVGEMDHTPNVVKYTVENMKDAAMERQNFPLLDSLRSERLSISNQLRDESRSGNMMGIPIVTVDQSMIHQRDEQLIRNQKLPVLPMEEAKFRRPNERYKRENKLLGNSIEESNFHQRDQNYKGDDMHNEASSSTD
ncbi:hypothetical protein DPV78_009306 [Talaromyces pinophilus]|nr:hypothetical protein DPV78_009306 [Talaromyces pinophilus]